MSPVNTGRLGTRRLFVTITGAALVAALLGALASRERDEGSLSVVRQGAAVSNEEAVKVIDKHFGQRSFENDASFGGTWITERGITVGVVEQPSKQLSDSVAAAREDAVPVQTQAVGVSVKRLQALVRTISRDIGYWDAKGVTITTIGPSVRDNNVEVGLKEYSDTYKEMLLSHYRGEPIVISQLSIDAGGS